jgi:hypothetical protein
VKARGLQILGKTLLVVGPVPSPGEFVESRSGAVA